MIDRIINILEFSSNNINPKQTPSTYMLCKDEDRQPRKDRMHYKSVISILNCLSNAIYTNISMGVH